MYRNSVDAFLHLVTNGHASEISSTIGQMINGVRYCSVQVEFEAGAEYYIEAYEQEAEDLYREATRRSTELRTAVKR